uniref:Uncharacterized protein n=1 Tax=Myoviridae sp. ctkfK18 TaxID=2825165 RepID=A0A8S5VGN7_9CAUD|nr:MAG TPA: hypothetical protein [Myoviridae sp. ctkfK18]
MTITYLLPSYYLLNTIFWVIQIINKNIINI